VLVNREFLERIGRAEHEVIGRTDFELIDPQMAAAYRRADREVLETCREIETEEHARKGERRTTYLVRKFALCDEDGRAYAGGSLILGPDGTVLARAGASDAALVAEYDLEGRAALARRVGFLTEARGA